MVKQIGLIAFANRGGLGIQTKRLYDMIKPHKVLLIDSSGFSKNKELNFDWYPEEITTITDGFPKNHDINKWIQNLNFVFTVENPYNFYLIHACREKRIKTICQTNFEFCENLIAPWLPKPDLFLMPSQWMTYEMKKRFGKDRVKQLQPPIDPGEFSKPRLINLNRNKNDKPRFLHIIGTLAFEDRNGTLDLLASVRQSEQYFELVIHSQHELPSHYFINDERVVYRMEDFKENSDLYTNFDALILPRRYGGLSLTTNEALMSGLPVIMPDISPNNALLPDEWLIKTLGFKTIKIRSDIECYSMDVDDLARKLDDLAINRPDKLKAYQLGKKHFSFDSLKRKYERLWI